ncbi:MAG: S8 family serine peptidase, partial [Geodermatophilaceae bacterium]
MSRTVGRGRRRVALIALTAAVVSQVGVGVATAAPATSGGASPLVDAELSAAQLAALQQAVQQSRVQDQLPSSGRVGFYVELDTASSGRVFQDNLARGEAAATAAARDAKTAIAALQRRLLDALPNIAPNSSELYRTSAVTAGVAVMTDVSNYRALFTLPNVKAVYPIAPKAADNAGVADLINAPEVWEALGNTGQGIDVGIIDTGIDYTHTDFGGSGSVRQYNLLRRVENRPAPAAVFPNEKVVGGFDFVGDEYTGENTPEPDPNPLDCNGHGSHVAGTAAGYGVNDDGSTYTGPYDTDLDLKALRIGPGMAPEANLWALRVFGCEGFTLVVGLALEYAADPNGDGSTADKLDVVNLSLGATYGLPDDADGVLAGRLQELGMMMVFSAGNSGDTYDVNGSPGNNPNVLSVAASDDGFAVFDGWEIVNRPDLFEPDIRPGLRSVAFEGEGDHTGDLVLPVPGDDPTACSPLSGDYSGQFLVIQADGFVCGSVTKSQNAEDAGATGFVIIADDDSLSTGITGDADIPGILIRASDGAVLVEHLEDGEQLTMHFGDSLEGAAVVDDPAAVDTLATFTSRGSRGSVKPDVTAPGVNTTSAGVGTGSGTLTISGTSMAAPATSGLAALVKAENPGWNGDYIKADIMNTAYHDLYTEPGQTGLVYAPNRVGAGRIDAPAALVNKVLAYSSDPFVVSATFGTVEVVEENVTQSKTIIVNNRSNQSRTYNLSYEALTTMPGVDYTLSTSSVTVPAKAQRTFEITLNVDRSEMRKTIDPTVSRTQLDIDRQYVADASGRILITPTAAGMPQLRVPVHANPAPASTLSTTRQATGFFANSVLTLAGQGVANGVPTGPQAFTSWVSAFSLLGTSPALPDCADAGVTGACVPGDLSRWVDLKNVGVVSDAPYVGAEDAFLYFAVAAHGEFATANYVNYSVFIDATGDGVWDYQLLTTYFTDGGDPIDVPIVIGADREGNLLPSNEEPAITF